MSADNAASSSTISGKGSKGTAAEAKTDANIKNGLCFMKRIQLLLQKVATRKRTTRRT